jgi:hypothetical protein
VRYGFGVAGVLAERGQEELGGARCHGRQAA